MVFAIPALLVALIVGFWLLGQLVGRQDRADGVWTVEHVDGRPFATNKPSMVSFRRGAMSATVGCNDFSAKYRLRGKNLRWIKSYGQTLMACFPEGVMKQESVVFDRLRRAQFLQRLPGDRLLLSDSGGHSLRLKPWPKPKEVLTGTWTLAE